MASNATFKKAVHAIVTEELTRARIRKALREMNVGVECNADDGQPCNADDGEPCALCRADRDRWDAKYKASSAQQRQADRGEDDQYHQDMNAAGRGHLLRRR